MTDLKPTDAWKPVSEARTDGHEVLACFKGQFDNWVTFVARANPPNIHGIGVRSDYFAHAAPTHWREMPEPPL